MTEAQKIYGKPETGITPVDRLKNILQAPTVQEQFKNALAENRNLFIASLIDLYASDKNLQQCDPAALVREALESYWRSHHLHLFPDQL